MTPIDLSKPFWAPLGLFTHSTPTTDLSLAPGSTTMWRDAFASYPDYGLYNQERIVPNFGSSLIFKDLSGTIKTEMPSIIKDDKKINMKATLKSISSLDIDCPLENYFPDDETNFGLNIRLYIGPENSDAEEAYDLFICTPEWIKKNHADGSIFPGRHTLIVQNFDFQKIKSYIEKYISGCSGENWQSIAAKLGRFASSEFEDYKPYNG